jgi:hypothetical protein
LSQDYGVVKTDMNGNILNTFSSGGAYRGAYFNQTDQTILVAAAAYARIDVFNQTLSLLYSITLPGNSPVFMEFYNNKLYVVASGGVVLILVNGVITSTIPTPYCSSGYSSIAIDDYGYMALSCNGLKTVHLYHTNGTYMNRGKSVVYPPWYMNLDLKGRFIISTHSGLIIFY